MLFTGTGCGSLTVQKGRAKATVEKPATKPCGIENIDKCNGTS
ncbi:hypothetical protein GPLA_4360 [Paraglaciecola polaris LMG 21857]|uniref:Uncharacterized protein n=1 Tax=Paraglaciecola polaris LMG 21857 TaxID=1129793 RepID=K6YR86_9ALTE|nr:hypothetical protein GPLA_4360 [Paraglaciecola polaris LMG 21857]